jgi:hypothetical protein
MDGWWLMSVSESSVSVGSGYLVVEPTGVIQLDHPIMICLTSDLMRIILKHL